MQGPNQLVRSIWGLGVLLRDTSTQPGWGIEPATLRLPDDCSYCLSHVALCVCVCACVRACVRVPMYVCVYLSLSLCVTRCWRWTSLSSSTPTRWSTTFCRMSCWRPRPCLTTPTDWTSSRGPTPS
ncbi:hypothetical protein COCON_G00199580 [Conger conger]|uniref:Uncharacterized protein n=1 Tax=Conger conger TaxID=82655 RepID=A0A9Q1D2G7_CONCO|nr:hypothetical protein COCON_G00199580 [Conger conger]